MCFVDIYSLLLQQTISFEVWGIPANGEAVELFSWRHGSVQVLRFLPAPQIIGKSIVDLFETKRPLIALCDTATPGPAYCSLCFLSLRTGEQVKQIKFKNPVLDVLANSRSVVVTFSEKIAIFDAFTLEDRLTVTTCYISPGIYPNPVALGARWMAYAEKNLIPLRRSSGGNEGEGVQVLFYTSIKPQCFIKVILLELHCNCTPRSKVIGKRFEGVGRDSCQ